MNAPRGRKYEGQRKGADRVKIHTRTAAASKTSIATIDTRVDAALAVASQKTTASLSRRIGRGFYQENGYQDSKPGIIYL